MEQNNATDSVIVSKTNYDHIEEVNRLKTFLFVLRRKSCLTLLNMGADVDSRDNKNQTPLMWAAMKNQPKCAEVLLDFKASLDLQDTKGDSALHLACFGGHAAIVTLLMDRGASLTLRNKEELTCIEIAAKAGSFDVAMVIVNHERLAGVLVTSPCLLCCFFTSSTSGKTLSVPFQLLTANITIPNSLECCITNCQVLISCMPVPLGRWLRQSTGVAQVH